ncbi:unnamed protein product, partial [Mesorhabditis spiculigera]
MSLVQLCRPTGNAGFRAGTSGPKNLSALESFKNREGQYEEAQLGALRLTAPLARFINRSVYRIICFLEADSLLTLRCPEFGFWLKEKDAASAERLLTTLISEWRTGSRRIVFGKCVAESSYIPEFMRDAIDGVITEGDRKLQIEFFEGCVYQFREIS